MLLVIVPTYNEEACIQRTLDDLARLPPAEFQLLVVNDASCDQTAARVRDWIASHQWGRLLTLDRNRGAGLSVWEGFRWALAAGHRYDAVIQFDADGQHRADSIEHLLRGRYQHGAELVVGSRFLQPATWWNRGASPATTAPRRLGGRTLSLVLSWATGRKFTDPTSGLRCYGLPLVRRLVEECPAGVVEPISLARACLGRWPVIEVPVQMDCRQGGTSSIHWGNALAYMTRAIAGIVAARREAQTGWGLGKLLGRRRGIQETGDGPHHPPHGTDVGQMPPPLPAAAGRRVGAAGVRPPEGGQGWQLPPGGDAGWAAALLGFCLACASAGCAGGALAPERVGAAGPPREGARATPAETIRSLPPVVLAESTEIPVEFVVTNDTREAWRGLQVRTSCGCAAAHLAQPDLAAGASTTLSLRISVQPTDQPYRKRAAAYLDLEAGPTRQYTAEVTVYPQVAATPRDFLFPASAQPPEGSTGEVQVEFYTAGEVVAGQPLTMLAEGMGDELAVRFQPPPVDQPGLRLDDGIVRRTGVVSLHLPGTARLRGRGDLHLEFRNPQGVVGKRALVVSQAGTVELLANPRRLMFDTVNSEHDIPVAQSAPELAPQSEVAANEVVEDRLRRTVRVFRRDRRPFVLARCESDDPGVSVRPLGEWGQRVVETELEVRVDGASAAGAADRLVSIQIAAEDADVEPLLVPVVIRQEKSRTATKPAAD